MIIDPGREVRRAEQPSSAQRILGILFGVPQALLGVVAIVMGIAMIGWVLYNSFIDRDPSYSGGFLRFGIGPVLVLFGARWLRGAFKKAPPMKTRAQA